MNEIDFINVNQSLSLEQEFGSGYIKFTDVSFNEDTGYYKMESKILDENYNMIGNLDINGRLCYISHNDHQFNIKYGMEVNLEGDMEQIRSLHKNI